jgi:hypothetical protein
MLIMACFGLALSGACVHTAECDEHIGCADGLVCYEFRCAQRCSLDTDCSEGQTCAPCVDEQTRSSGGRCHGEDARVCVQSPET